MNLGTRLLRQTRFNWVSHFGAPTPPLLILFINSLCNQKCEHCFYWQSLNGKDDLTLDEMLALSRSMGKIEILNLSGGEPFLRPEFGQICRQFISHNGVRQIYVPSNGYFADRTVKHITETLQEKDLDQFTIELSLDGLAEFHDRFRVSPGSFKRSMATYDALVELQDRDPRLRIHATSTATAINMDELRRLTTYLFERCPRMDHHNLAMIRGERKNPSLAGPDLARYGALYDYIRRLWAPREQGRPGASVEPMLQARKQRTAEAQTQVVPCTAGKLSGVIYANGDVGVCETHPPVGNLRKNTFPEIWNAPHVRELRDSIARKDCWCTQEIPLWSSIAYQPIELAKAALNARVWDHPAPLPADQRVPVTQPPDVEVQQLISIQTAGKR
jgi:MoaA/NifB/PqqE/SkfB family radical SAM enzyme